MRRPAVAFVVTAMLWLGLTIGGTPGVASAGTPLPGAPNCPIFPADNVWNTPITSLPVDPHSAQWLAAMDASTTNLQPVAPPTYGMPINVVPPGHAFIPLAFGSSGNDPGPYPFGPDTQIEGGTGDRHAIMVDPATCTDYELYDAFYTGPTTSHAANGAIWNLNSDALRGGLATVDAAGTPILAGLMRYDEVQSGVITHAIRVQATTTDTSYIWPATAGEGSAANPNLPPMGARFRLKASFDISGYSPQAQVVLRALQQYGLILDDNGPNWHFWADANPGWPSSLLNELKTVPGERLRGGRRVGLDGRPQLGAGPPAGAPRSTARRSPATAWSPRTAVCSRSASRSSAPWVASTSTRPSWAWRRRRDDRATGWWRPTGGSSATATPASTARRGACV